MGQIAYAPQEIFTCDTNERIREGRTGGELKILI